MFDEDQIELPNGGHLRVRPLRRGEYGPVRELFARLSLRSRYLRFLSPIPFVGLVVADAWQRQGIGVALGARLLHAAEVRGYHRFVVHGLLDNPALRPLLNHLARIVSSDTRFGVSEITFVRRAT